MGHTRPRFQRLRFTPINFRSLAISGEFLSGAQLARVTSGRKPFWADRKSKVFAHQARHSNNTSPQHTDLVFGVARSLVDLPTLLHHGLDSRLDGLARNGSRADGSCRLSANTHRLFSRNRQLARLALAAHLLPFLLSVHQHFLILDP